MKAQLAPIALLLFASACVGEEVDLQTFAPHTAELVYGHNAEQQEIHLYRLDSNDCGYLSDTVAARANESRLELSFDGAPGVSLPTSSNSRTCPKAIFAGNLALNSGSVLDVQIEDESTSVEFRVVDPASERIIVPTFDPSRVRAGATLNFDWEPKTDIPADDPVIAHLAPATGRGEEIPVSVNGTRLTLKLPTNVSGNFTLRISHWANSAVEACSGVAKCRHLVSAELALPLSIQPID